MLSGRICLLGTTPIESVVEHAATRGGCIAVG